MTGDLRSTLRELVRLAWPIAFAQIGIVALGLVDVAVIGRVSVDDLAGAAMGRSIGFSSTAFGMGVTMALEPLAAQALGAGEPVRAWEALRTTLRAVILVWIPTTAMSFAVTLLLEPFGVEPDLVPRVQAYMLGQAPGFVFYSVFLAYKTFLQAHGHTRPALLGAVVANAANFVVCNLLVRGDDALRDVDLPALGLPRLGAFGAGLASTIASLLLALVVYRAAREYRGHATGLFGSRVALGRVLRLGLPIGAMILAEMGVFTLVALIAGKLGKYIVSAHQVAIGLASFTYMGSLGVASATAVKVGHAVGAGLSPRRVGLLGIALGAAVMSVPAAVFAIAPESLIRLFTNDPDVTRLGVVLLRIAALFQLFDGVQAVASGALRGAGDVRYAFLTNVAAYWLIGLPIALVLAFPLGWGAAGLWWGLTVGLVLAAIVLGARFVRVSSRAITRL